MTTIAETTSTTAEPSPAEPSTWNRLKRGFSRHRISLLGLAEHAMLAGLAYIPLVLVKAGVVTSDTKTYLYLDPGRFLRQATSMWDPTVGLGTVTHQYIGYLLPMGPFYWFFSVIGVPVWVAQRLWLGSILFAAGAGVLYLSRTLQLRAPARTVAALAFMLSPYFLQYSGRISVILLPWAGLPFMVALTAKALRDGGWRYPALFAIVVALTSGINATAILYVGVAPILWLLFAVFVQREVTLKTGIVVAARLALLTILTCLWWITGLIVEAAYGVDVLRYTETLRATTSTSSASDVIRGLGYWYFYGQDRLGAWTASVLLYTQHLWLVALSYLVPVLSFLGGVIARWRHRTYFVVLVLVGVVLSVGSHPFSNPTPVGSLLKKFMVDTTAGLALRSTDRATPLVILGLAMLLGSGVSALRRRLPRTSLVIALAVVTAVIADNPAIFNGDAEVASFFVQPAKLPTYQMKAITHLNTTHPGTRVLAIPGEQFASSRFGDTVDPPQPAFLTRPYVTREQQVMGSIATADTLAALDDPIELGTEQWSSLAPMARLLSAGDVLVQYDQRFEHYNSPEPQLLAQDLAKTPDGLSDPVSFGTPRPNTPSYSYVDDQNLAPIAPLPNPPPLVDYTVDNPRPVTRGESNAGALIVAGDGVGLEELAAAGLLNTDSAIYYASTLDKDPVQLDELLGGGADVVLTDTNRKQAFRWDTFVGDYGYTETPADNPARNDPSDSPLDLTPRAPIDSKTVAAYLGALDATASSYGSADSYAPETSAYAAIDSNLDTSWTTGIGIPDPAGQWWQLQLGRVITTDQVTLVQPQNGNTNRTITRVTLTFDGGRPLTVRLGAASRTAVGQKVPFAPRSFRTLRITIDATSDDTVSAAAATAVGFGEVELPGVHAFQIVKMPTDLLKDAGAASVHDRLTIDMSRERVSPFSFPYRTDPETTIAREFTLPTARTFTLTGTASLSALIPDDEIDRLVGREAPGQTNAVVAYSKGRLPGDLAATASAAADGNPATAWQPGFGAPYQKGQWLEYDLQKPITFDHLDLQVVADGLHSVPTSIEVSARSGTRSITRSITLPKITNGLAKGSTVSVPVSFPALTGQQIRVTVTGVRFSYGENFYSGYPIALPLGIAEVGIPGVQVNPLPADLPGSCQSNLITIDGRPISVAVVGSAANALANGEMTLVPCGPDAGGITLGPGQHVVLTSLGHSTATGWNVDQLTLDSAPGAGPGSAAAFGSLAATQPGPAPSVRVIGQTSTSEQLQVTGVTGPFELVLGESVNQGWKAVASPQSFGGPPPKGSRSLILGPSQLVDAFANGWPVTAADLSSLGAVRTGVFTISLTWTPQEQVWEGLIVSALALLLCLGIALFPLRRFLRRRSAAAAVPLGDMTLPASPHDDDSPLLAAPWRGRGTRPTWWAVAVVAAATGGVAGAVTTWRLGAVVAVAAAAALSLRWLRGLLTLGAVGFVTAAGTVVVVGKATGTTQPNLASWLVWIALVALAADAVVATARMWRPERRPSAPPTGPPAMVARLLARLPGRGRKEGEPGDGAGQPAEGPEESGDVAVGGAGAGEVLEPAAGHEADQGAAGEDVPSSGDLGAGPTGLLARLLARLPGRGQKDGGQPRDGAGQPVEGPEEPGDVVVGGAGQGDVLEPAGGQEADQGAPGEDVQVADDLGAGPTVDAPDAHLGEEGLDAEDEQGPVVPGGQVGGGEEEGPPGGEDAAGLEEGGVGVDQVLDDLPHDDGVDAAVAEGQAGAIEPAAGDGETEGPGPAGGLQGPVDPEDPGLDPGGGPAD